MRWVSWGAACAAALLLLEAAKLVLFAAGGPAPLDGDAGGYWGLGEQVARGDWWMRQRPVGFRTPGYPWLLGVFQSVCGSQAWHAVVIVQHVAVGLSTLLTGYWTYRLTGGRWWLVNVALLLRFLSMAQAGYAGTVLTEACFEPLFLAVLILLTEPDGGNRGGRWPTVGALFALAFLLRPAVVALVPVLLAAALLNETQPLTLKQRLWGGGRRLWPVFLIGVLLVGPWCVRNALVFGRATPVIFLGRELWMGVYGPGQPAGPALPDTPEGAQIRNVLGMALEQDAWQVNWATSGALTRSGLDDAAADQLMEKVAKQGIWRDPIRFSMRTVWRMIDFWRTTFSRELFLYGDEVRDTGIGNDQQRWGTEAARQRRARWLDAALENRLLMIELGSVFGLVGALGLCLHPRTWRSGVVIAGTLVCVGVLSGALDIPNYRLRMILEPVLIVGALAGGEIWWKIVSRGVKAVWQDSRPETNL